MGNQIDKIVLSKNRMNCMVYFVNGTALYFNFFRMRMTYTEFLEWLPEMTNVGFKQAA